MPPFPPTLAQFTPPQQPPTYDPSSRILIFIIVAASTAFLIYGTALFAANLYITRHYRRCYACRVSIDKEEACYGDLHGCSKRDVLRHMVRQHMKKNV
ncbi:hypothetical protein P280DRAFT_473789 [Massarina eburnea CBS 473.64]|uniref:Uncharacterized protein n=1 Tax=Massarina eburnea CBS 473.64 TaxID=1395130 RepID=A0A6A6RM03_9PLEO|nr:hypothetical protein P280DRAFT_473789 [Massarina eburnea CBS 473.64]